MCSNRFAAVYVDKAAPVRVVSLVSLLTATLDLFGDIIMCIRFGDVFQSFGCIARNAAICYFVFVGFSIVVYIIEWVDCIVTFIQNQETRWLCKLSRSLYLALEEIPLPLCLLTIYRNEPRTALANPAMIASAIKLVALLWLIVKFVKMKFCWFCLPCILDHGLDENVRRCFTMKWWRVAMFFVNVCLIVAIVLSVVNIAMTSSGGKILSEADYPPCYATKYVS